MIAQKGRQVVTTSATKTIADAIEILAAQKIGALVVVEDRDRIVGIVSERDVVRAIAKRGCDALPDKVSEIMTREVMTCTETETINDVMSRMTAGRFRHLPVAANGRLTGIISIGDVVKARIEQVEQEAEEMRAYIATA
jgi:CBS domain-containing protein